jgi:hypothetical protein
MKRSQTTAYKSVYNRRSIKPERHQFCPGRITAIGYFDYFLLNPIFGILNFPSQGIGFFAEDVSSD